MTRADTGREEAGRTAASGREGGDTPSRLQARGRRWNTCVRKRITSSCWIQEEPDPCVLLRAEAHNITSRTRDGNATLYLIQRAGSIRSCLRTNKLTCRETFTAVGYSTDAHRAGKTKTRPRRDPKLDQGCSGPPCDTDPELNEDLFDATR